MRIQWVDLSTGSEAFIGFLRFSVWLEGTKWVFSFAGKQSVPRYSSREVAKLSGLRFAKRFMTKAISLIEQSDGYSDPPPKRVGPPIKETAAADAKAEQDWMASLFTTGVES